MTTIHEVDAVVFLTDSNRSGDRTFNLFSGVVGNGNLLSEPSELQTGAVVADLTSVPGTFDQSVTLFRVTDDGVNELDEQPAKGDVIVTVGPAPLAQAGQVSIVTDNDGGILTVGLGLVMAMFPLFIGMWMDENLADAVDARIEAYLSATAEQPTPETDPQSDDVDPIDVDPSGEGDPLPPASDTEQESPGVPVGDAVEAPADGTPTDLPGPADPEPTVPHDANDGLTPDIVIEDPAPTPTDPEPTDDASVDPESTDAPDAPDAPEPTGDPEPPDAPDAPGDPGDPEPTE